MDLIMKLIDIGTDKVTGSYNHQIELKRGENDSDPFHLRSENQSFFRKSTYVQNLAMMHTLNRAETTKYE